MGGFGHDLKTRGRLDPPLLVIDTEIDGPERFLFVPITWSALEALRAFLQERI